MSVRQKIEARIDEVERLMKEQAHLEDPEMVVGVIETVSKFWSALSEDERDFINSARYAIEDQIEWK